MKLAPAELMRILHGTIAKRSKPGITVFSLRFSTRLLCSIHEQSKPSNSTNPSSEYANKVYLAEIALAM
jgi:hypothetical protein